MNEWERHARRLLTELAAAVAADGGVTLYVDCGDGGMEIAVTVPGADPVSSWRHRSRDRDGAGSCRRLLVSVPDARRGVVLLERRGPEEFSADDRAVARLYARQLAEQVAIDRVQSQASLWTRQLEAIQAAVAQLTRLTTVEDVGKAICVETHRVIDYDAAWVYVLDAERGLLEPIARRTSIAASAAEQRRAAPVQLVEGIVGWVATHGTARVVENVEDEQPPGDAGAAQDSAGESELVVPLRDEQQVLGVIVLSRRGGVRGFDENDLRLMQILSDQAAVAMKNAQLLAARERVVQELKALLAMGRATEFAENEATMADVFCERFLSASRVDACVISRLDENSTVLRTVGARGLQGDVPACDALDYRLMRRALRDETPQVIQQDATGTDPAEAWLMSQLGARTLLLLPLLVGRTTVGLVELIATAARREFLLAELDALQAMANQAATVLENARLVEQLRQAADIDQVTGVNNHRFLQERLKQECARSARSHSPMSVLMIDLDGFKQVNDRYGHADGDRVLRTVAAGLKTAVRTSDVVARYGGDEFVILMPDTDEGQARAVATRIVDEIGHQRHEMSEGGQASVGASAGLSVYPEDGHTPKALLEAADAAMYAVKRAGGGDVRRGSAAVRGRGAPRSGAWGRRPPVPAVPAVPAETGEPR